MEKIVLIPNSTIEERIAFFSKALNLSKIIERNTGKKGILPVYSQKNKFGDLNPIPCLYDISNIKEYLTGEKVLNTDYLIRFNSEIGVFEQLPEVYLVDIDQALLKYVRLLNQTQEMLSLSKNNF